MSSDTSGSSVVWVLGAGFSKAAGMPLATELLEPLVEQLYNDEELRGWLQSLSKILNWLDSSSDTTGLRINIEQVFHYGYLDAEARRLQQHLTRVGRGDGPDTRWNGAETVEHWLRSMEESLVDVISEREETANLNKLAGWASAVRGSHSILTFNYDTLAERALAQAGVAWNHGTRVESEKSLGVSVLKMHGSVDWILADRRETLSKCDLIFDEENTNRGVDDKPTGHVEDDCRLWRCKSGDQLKRWLDGRDLQSARQDGWLPRPALAGLGAYKELHAVPGLGEIWANAMNAVHRADQVIVVGFQMSDFDAMAQLQFAASMMKRHQDGRPPRVAVVDPGASVGAFTERFRRVFREVKFIAKRHEEFEWSGLW